jgi:hypothetical protein
MDMRQRVLTLSFVALIVSIGTAYAEDCAAITQAIKQIGNGQSSYKMPAAEECSAESDSYTCIWLMPSISQSIADFDSTAKQISACLPGATLSKTGNIRALVTGRSHEAFILRRGAEITLIFERVK